MSDVLDTISGEGAPAESVLADAIAGEPKLWAGKYKSPEELEEAYKNSAKVYNENKELKEKLKTPEKYELPADINLKEAERREIEAIARKSGLNQDQFESTAREMSSRLDAQREALANARKAIGDDKIAILEQYVKDYYPDRLHGAILNQLIKDGEAMKEALVHRDQLLNSRVPGMAEAGGVDNKGAQRTSYDGQKEVMEAAKEYKRNPTRHNKERYIALAAEVGNERFSKKD